LEVTVPDKPLGWIFSGLLLAAALGLPLVANQDQVLTLAILVFLNASLASSWNIIGGFAGQVNLGHAAFFGLGALVARLLWLQGVPFPLAFLAGGAAAAVAAFFLGYPGLRLKGIYFSIGTLALAEAIRITVGNFFPTVTALPSEGLRAYSLVSRYYLSLGVLLLSVGVTAYLLRSKLGLGMLATREDEDAARSIGVNIFRHKLTAFVISAALAGLTGASFAYFFVSYYPSLTFGPEYTFNALIIVFVGGIGTLAGPLIGAVFFVLVQNLLAVNLVDLHLLIFGVLFVLVVLLFPGGLVEGWDQLRLWSRSLRRHSERRSADKSIV
jgi:branched-chain amino acid transport system permease protein